MQVKGTLGIGQFSINSLRAVASALISILVLAAPARAEQRVALIIGNSAYQANVVLRNPVNDAQDVAAALRRLGFDVTAGYDLGGEQFTAVLEQFRPKLKGSEVALFYYAGHGLQFSGQNYLAPVDVRLASEFALKRETIAADDIVRLFEANAHINLIFLDACRNNPLAEQLRRAPNGSGRAAGAGRGLARMETGGETLIAFSTAPGEIAEDGAGRNSPFAEALLRHMEEPGIDVEVMLKRVTEDVRKATNDRQRPERLSKLSKEFAFRPAASPALQTASAGQAPASAGAPEPVQPKRNSEEEIVYWNSVRETGDRELLKSYLDRYPGGVFTVIAQARLREMTARERRANTPALRSNPPAVSAPSAPLASAIAPVPPMPTRAPASSAPPAELSSAFAPFNALASASTSAPAPASASAAPSGGGFEDHMYKRIEQFIIHEHFQNREHFSDRVDYFEKGLVSRDFAIQDSETYARKWPHRRYDLMPGTLKVYPNGDGRYAASFGYTFEVANGAKTVRGRGYSRLLLIFSDGRFQVSGVKEVVQK
jgi:hypothetical protein